MPSLLPTLLLLCALPSPARADDFTKLPNNTRVVEPEAKAMPPSSCMKGIKPALEGQFCDNVADCRKFCSCACVFNPDNWPAPAPGVHDDGSTKCGASMPDTGPGMLPPNSPALHPIPNMDFITVRPGATAIQETIDGLRRLSDGLRTSKHREKHNYTVRLRNCYRPHRTDSVPECGYILKGKYILSKKNIDENMRAYWEEHQNPLNLGLAWPGMTPHSGGYACDLVLVDGKGQDCFDWRAGVKGTPTCSIKQSLASALLDLEVTSAAVGGKRLRYEAWHYEWGPNASGCVYPDCAQNHWPPRGKP